MVSARSGTGADYRLLLLLLLPLLLLLLLLLLSNLLLPRLYERLAAVALSVTAHGVVPDDSSKPTDRTQLLRVIRIAVW